MASTDTNSTQRSAEHVSLWLGATLFVGLPYIIVGVVWAGAHSEHLTNVHGLDRVLSYLGEIFFWPLLLVSDITLK